MKKKSILSLSILLMMSAFFIGCDVTSSQKEEENSLMTDDIREIVPENQVVVRDYTRVLNTDLLTKIKSAQTRRSRGMQEDETSDFVTLQAEEELFDFYMDMPDELKTGFEEACANDDVKVEYHYLTTVELENQTDLTSDYIQAKIAEGEMLKEIENNFFEEELILTANESVDAEEDLSMMELYNDSSSRNKRINIKKYLSYRKAESSRSALANNEVKVNAASVVHFLALLNYQDEVMEIAKLLDKDIDIRKIKNYHKKLNSISRACAGTIITPDDIYNSSSDQYGYAWFRVWVPTGYWSWKQTGKWWEWWKGKWEWTSTGGFYAWKFGRTKIYSKKTKVVTWRKQ